MLAALPAALGDLDLSTIVTLAAFAGLLGGAYAFFTVSKNRGLLELYKAEAEAEKRRGDRIEGEAKQLKERVAALEGANAVLAQQVSGSDAVRDLKEALQQQHVEQMGVLTALLHNLADRFGGPSDG